MHDVGRRYIEIVVESNEELAQDVCQRFQAIGEPREVRRIEYEPDDGPAGTWRVFGKSADGSIVKAQAVEVDDSGAGTSTLIWGGDYGLRLEREGGRGETIAEAFLLLPQTAVLE